MLFWGNLIFEKKKLIFVSLAEEKITENVTVLGMNVEIINIILRIFSYLINLVNIISIFFSVTNLLFEVIARM